MEKYIENNIHIVVQLSRKAHSHNVSFKKFANLANVISHVLHETEKKYGIYYLHYTAYMAALVLGHSVGPLTKNITNKLLTTGCIITKIV